MTRGNRSKDPSAKRRERKEDAVISSGSRVRESADGKDKQEYFVQWTCHKCRWENNLDTSPKCTNILCQHSFCENYCEVQAIPFDHHRDDEVAKYLGLNTPSPSASSQVLEQPPHSSAQPPYRGYVPKETARQSADQLHHDLSLLPQSPRSRQDGNSQSIDFGGSPPSPTESSIRGNEEQGLDNPVTDSEDDGGGLDTTVTPTSSQDIQEIGRIDAGRELSSVGWVCGPGAISQSEDGESPPIWTPASSQDWQEKDSHRWPRVPLYLSGVIDKAHSIWWALTQAAGNRDDTGGGEERSDGSRGSASAQSDAGGRSSNRKKRTTRDEDEESRDRATKSRTLSRGSRGSESTEATRFACPFYKRRPHRYQACCNLQAKKISHVKQHFWRKHMQPIHCPTCRIVFSDTGLRDIHVGSGTCQAPPRVEVEWITPAQELELRRPSPRSEGLSEESQWYRVFEIVFGEGAPKPKSPYNDSLEELTQFQDFLVSEGAEIQLQTLGRHPAWTHQDTQRFREAITLGLSNIVAEWAARRNSGGSASDANHNGAPHDDSFVGEVDNAPSNTTCAHHGLYCYSQGNGEGPSQAAIPATDTSNVPPESNSTSQFGEDAALIPDPFESGFCFGLEDLAAQTDAPLTEPTFQSVEAGSSYGDAMFGDGLFDIDLADSCIGWQSIWETEEQAMNDMDVSLSVLPQAQGQGAQEGSWTTLPSDSVRSLEEVSTEVDAVSSRQTPARAARPSGGTHKGSTGKRKQECNNTQKIASQR